MTFSPAIEQIVSDQTQGNVNNDGYVCVQNHAAPQGDNIAIDNRRQSG